MRIFFIDYGSKPEVTTEKGFENFVKVAVLHNKDISIFTTIEIDSRLKVGTGFKIAQKLGFAGEYLIETQNGMTPFESIVSHIKLKGC